MTEEGPQFKIFNDVDKIFRKNIIYDIIDDDDTEEFKTKNGTMSVEINGERKEFSKLTLKLGGRSSRSYGKPCYNIKIRNKDDLYGRTQFKIRSGSRDATFLRNKLACDIHNALGIPSISANYLTLYINEDYLGFYIIMDAIKLSWVEFLYNDKNSTFLYKCDDVHNGISKKTAVKGCTNENENFTDKKDWEEFLTSIDEAESANNLEDILDIDQYLTEIALEYLFGSWDHYPVHSHNFYFYKANSVDKKWKYLIYDFDGEFGQDINSHFISQIEFPSSKSFFISNSTLYSSLLRRTDSSLNETEINQNNKTIASNNIEELFIDHEDKKYEFAAYSFIEWYNGQDHLIKILILNHPTRFVDTLKKIITKVFNPTILFPHIDEIKKFITPYVKKEKYPDENGKYPGNLDKSLEIYSLEQWDANSEFTAIADPIGRYKSYGIKYWILVKYRYLCQILSLECDSKYMDENFEYPININVDYDTIFSNNDNDNEDNDFDNEDNDFDNDFDNDTDNNNNDDVGNIGNDENGDNTENNKNIENDNNTEDVKDNSNNTNISDNSTIISSINPSTTTAILSSTTTSTTSSTSLIIPSTTTSDSSLTTSITITSSSITTTSSSSSTSLTSSTSISAEISPSSISSSTTSNVETTSTSITETTTSNVETTSTTITETTTSSVETTSNSITETTTSKETPYSFQCYAELLNYPCCSSSITEVFAHDNLGDWGYDFEKKTWCGLTSYKRITSNQEELCWSEKFGYSCCKKCVVYETDNNGKWGYENNHWCGIPSYCNINV
jgi:hypothetical protein